MQTVPSIEPLVAQTRFEQQTSFLEQVDFLRLDATRKLNGTHQAEMGQFLTAMPTARLMAAMLSERSLPVIHLLDAGAGVGSLSAACIAEICHWNNLPQEISVIAYEIDPDLVCYLESTLNLCNKRCQQVGIKLTWEILQEDFIEAGVAMLQGGIFAVPLRSFNYAILNPPYRKINSNSRIRKILQTIGIETSNLYTAFLWLVMQMLESGSDLIAITPRSFCNGPYFKKFRQSFLSTMTLRQLHVFECRDRAFQQDAVLQENVIFHAVKENQKADQVIISSSADPEDPTPTFREISYNQLVIPTDPNFFIHIVLDDLGDQVAKQMGTFSTTLEQLGLEVSTGRVVDFRAKSFLRSEPAGDTVPLIYPCHCIDGTVSWPKQHSKKPNALVISDETANLLVPAGFYVLVKRFSAKEERRRVVATLYDPHQVQATDVGFENHLNYYHCNGNGLPVNLAKGLLVFLNSTLVDSYFRQFNGHTQVNATDLRSFNYPSRQQLETLGTKIKDTFLSQDEIDRYVAEELQTMSNASNTPDPVQATRRLEEAKAILRDLGLPKAQQNDRSALTLLALLDLKADDSWSRSSNPLLGITPIMEFISDHYGKKYAPNSRETVRRFTVHQFVEAGIVVVNSDQPRPTNSPDTVYQIEASTLELLRTYGSDTWSHNLRTYLTSIEILRKRYAQERALEQIPIIVTPGRTISLSPGGQNVLVEQIINEFCSRFTPSGTLIYIGDTADKFAYFDHEALAALGVTIDKRGKMPDVVVHHPNKNWLVLIEAVTSHGPINPKRQNELRQLFRDSTAGLVFVTAFLNRKDMVKYLNEISWETEVWVAESPTHMIHFNGERFLGPY
jgi:adenine-specific DNA-methyltransferase